MDYYLKLVAGALLGLLSFGASANVWDSQFLGRGAPHIINRTGGPINVGGIGGGNVINSGTGGALVRATTTVGVNGTGTALTLSKSINAHTIARVGLRAARMVGPVGIASLAIEGLRYYGGKWQREDESINACYTLSAYGTEACSIGDFLGQINSREPQDARIPFELKSTWGSPVITACSVRYPGICSQAARKTIETVIEWNDATDGDIQDAIERELNKPAKYGLASGVLGAAIGAAGDALRDILDEIPTEVSGPTSTPGPTTTTTTNAPGGSTTTTTTNTTNNYNYSGDTVTVTTTTTINHGDGSVTITESDPNPDPEAVPDPGDAPDGPDQVLCDKYPDAVACQKTGEIEAVELPKRTIPLAMTPEEGFGAGAVASCPADVTFPWQGVQLAMSWQPFCNLASGIRPIVIAMAYLSALLGFFAFARRD